MSRSVVPLNVIASDLCSDTGDSTGKYKLRFTRHLINGYRNLNMFLNGATEVKTVVLDYSNVINLPCDFQYVTKVGVRRPDSTCIAVLTLKEGVERRVLNDTDTCNYLNRTWSGQELGPQFVFYNAWTIQGYYYGELYGMGRGLINSGTYSIDKQNGVIYIGSNIPPDSQVIVEYVGNGISNGLTVVPMEMKECLEFYGKWKHYADKNPSLARMNEEWYKKEYNKLKRYYNHRTPMFIADAVNAVISPTNY